jgi:nanoRNase/pAp phosphatase (c-di-AMP/oligoRNAs hydrolase)
VSTPGKFRLVTRSDFDGLVCAVLLKEQNLLDEILFVHPKDVQDGKIPIDSRDILTNLPYVAAAHLVFDHHASEMSRLGSSPRPNHILAPRAASASRVVYDHFGGKAAFPNVALDMMRAVDQGDSARFTMDEVLHPTGWVLLNFLMDARTGLGRFRTFRVSNYQLMMHLIDYCRAHRVDEILELPDVVERKVLYFEHAGPAREQIMRCSTVHGSTIVLDLREEETIYVTNRFILYALFPESKLSIHVLWGLKKQNTVFAIGKSIFNRSSKVDVGRLTLGHGGGGHVNAGTCQVSNETAVEVLDDLLEKIETAEMAEAAQIPVF